MLSPRHKLSGLDGLARSFATSTWTNWQMNFGHRAAGVVCACYLVQDGLVEPDASGPLSVHIAREWAGLPLFAPLPEEPADPRELERLLAALAVHVGTHRHIGHDVIYPSLALRVLRDHPETVTRSRIDGLLQMVETYGATGAPEAPPCDGRHDPHLYSAWLLDAFIRSTDVSQRSGHGHLLTYGRAVLDLYALGYTEIARRAEGGLRRFIEDCLLPPPPSPPPKTPTAPYEFYTRAPETSGYWSHLPVGALERSYAHAIKYAYAFTGFCRLARDQALVAKARECYLVLAG